MVVERIYIALKPRGSQIECERVNVVAGAGIEGDRYFGMRTGAGQNITLIEAEEIEAFADDFQRPHDLSVTHRNLITRGVRLNALVGRTFTIGDVELCGIELCEPCLGLGKLLACEELPAAKVVERLVHRAGLRADVLTTGVIMRGAAIATIS